MYDSHLKLVCKSKASTDVTSIVAEMQGKQSYKIFAKGMKR